MRAIVTGGAGFIGSTLVDRLVRDNWQVSVVDDLSSGAMENLQTSASAITFHQLDVLDDALAEVAASAAPEVIFHLAAQPSVNASWRDPLGDYRTNALGTLNVLEAARRLGSTKVVFAASGGTLYGDPEELPTSERAPRQPLSPYGLSKAAGLELLEFYARVHGVATCALALANVYGPRQDPHGEAGVVAIFAGDAVHGRRSTIFGDGEQSRDFVYVDDVVEAFMCAAASGSGLINIGTAQLTSVREVHRLIAAAAGSSDDPAFGEPRAGEVRHCALDASRAKEQLGWVPKTGVAEGVAAVAAARRARTAD